MNFIQNLVLPQNQSIGHIAFQSHNETAGKISRIKPMTREDLQKANIEDILKAPASGFDREYTFGGIDLFKIKFEKFGKKIFFF